MSPVDLDWSGCANARDLGGLPAANGTRVRSRVLVRTDDLTRLDDGGRAAFESYGAGLIVDLRFLFELEEKEHPFAADAAYRSLPFIPQAFHDARDPGTVDSLPMVQRYVAILDASQETVGAAVRAVLEAPQGPVVVHCVSGKDRTGMLVALMLDLVGVPRDLIAKDYALSEERLGIPAMLQAMEADPGRTAEEHAAAVLSSRTLPESILGALEHLDAEYGGTDAYLRACGLGAEELQRLRDRLVEPVPPSA